MNPYRVTRTTTCGACNQPLGSDGYYHVRLGVFVHDADPCMSSLRGEDVRGHCMIRAASER